MTDPMELVRRLESGSDRFLKWVYKETYSGAPVISIPRHPDNIDVILTEAAACIREMVEWQPIETAPHETLVVLGWFEDGVWKQDLGLASAGQRWPTGFSNMWCHGSATHWLPLRPAPGAEA